MGQPMPYTMCQGKPGQIIAWNLQGEANSVSIFDITQIPFRVVVPQMELGTRAWHMCYCELPGVGAALAVTSGLQECKLSMFSLDSGELLWSVGGKDKRWLQVNVAGTEWVPKGVCGDNRGRLYVADYDNHRIIVLSAASGSVLQVVHCRRHWEVGQGWVSDPGVTVYGADIEYEWDDYKLHKELISGSVLQEVEDKHSHLLWPKDIYWNEDTKSVIVRNTNEKIIHFQIEF